MYSCSREEINPSILLPDIARDVLSLQRELSNLWDEYSSLALDSGLIDPAINLSELDDALEDTLVPVSQGELPAISATYEPEIPWMEEFGEPERIHYGRDGVISYTLITGETFTSND